MNKLPLAIGVVLLHAAIFAAGAAAQSRDRSENRAERTADRQPELAYTLAGPSVDPADPDTLVVYEYDGQLQELGLPPAEAAILCSRIGTIARAAAR